MANEDSSLERTIVQKLGSARILSVCGSGARALPLLNGKVQKLHCVDLSSPQLSLAKLRLELIRKLAWEDYLRFWGHAPFSPQDNKGFRKECLKSLDIAENDMKLFTQLHEEQDWQSLLYVGKWESSFATFGKVVQTVLGPKALELFQFSDLDAQKAWVEKFFPRKRWNLLVKIIGNRATFNALLYKGNFIKKNVPGSYFDYYSGAFNHLFLNGLAKENFFLQLCMLGGVRFPEGNIIEARQSVYEDMKKNADRVEISFIEKDILNCAKDLKGWDFVSISDVPSYFSGDIEKNFLQEIRESLNPGGVVVLRNYLRIPSANREGFKDLAASFEKEISAEKTQMYKVEILQKT